MPNKINQRAVDETVRKIWALEEATGSDFDRLEREIQRRKCAHTAAELDEITRRTR